MMSRVSVIFDEIYALFFSRRDICWFLNSSNQLFTQWKKRDSTATRCHQAIENLSIHFTYPHKPQLQLCRQVLASQSCLVRFEQNIHIPS